MISGIILLAVGIIIIVATRAYLHEPVVRVIGFIIGVVLAVVGAYLLLVAVLAGIDTHPDTQPRLHNSAQR